MEKNLKNRFNRIYGNGINLNESFREPYIGIIQFGPDNSNVLFPVLFTRFGDIVVITDAYIPCYSAKETTANINRIKEEKSKIYSGIKIKHLTSSDDVSIDDEYTWRIVENKMKKYIDTKNNKTYLLYTSPDPDSNINSAPNGKYALSISADYLLNTYCIRKLIDSLPSIQLSQEELFEYSIIAL